MFSLFFGLDKDYKTPGDKPIGEVSFTVNFKEKVNTLCLTIIICVCMVTEVMFFYCMYLFSLQAHLLKIFIYIVYILLESKTTHSCSEWRH